MAVFWAPMILGVLFLSRGTALHSPQQPLVVNASACFVWADGAAATACALARVLTSFWALLTRAVPNLSSCTALHSTRQPQRADQCQGVQALPRSEAVWYVSLLQLLQASGPSSGP